MSPKTVSNTPEVDISDNRVDPATLQIVHMPIGNVRPHPQNNNVGDKAAISESMDELGFFDPVTVQASTGRLITGNHTWEVYKSKGADTIPAIVLDVDDPTALRMMAAHNKTNRRGHEDEAATLALLQAIQDTTHEAYGLCGTGYTLDDVDDLLDKFGQLPVTAMPDVIEATWAESPEQEAERAEAMTTRGTSTPKALGMKEMVLIMPVDDHADIMRSVASLRKSLPGGYPTGRLMHAAIKHLEYALDSGAGHPDPCPCLNCEPSDDHPDACVCLSCTDHRRTLDLKTAAGLVTAARADVDGARDAVAAARALLDPFRDAADDDDQDDDEDDEDEYGDGYEDAHADADDEDDGPEPVPAP